MLLVLAGVRPEEIAEWEDGTGRRPSGALNFAASADAQAQAGGAGRRPGPPAGRARVDAVVLIDTLDGLHPPAARKVLASGAQHRRRRLADRDRHRPAPLGGETTVIALDAQAGRAPAGSRRSTSPRPGRSGPSLLVGEDGAEAIARMRSQALDS